MKHFFHFHGCLFPLFFIVILSGCARHTVKKAEPQQQPAQKLIFKSSDQLQTIRSRGTLRVGVSIFVPWIMHENKGHLIGYEIDVAKKLAEDIGVTPEFVETSWPSILSGLLMDKYDIIISGLSLTPKRALLINFSKPYSHSTSILLANRRLAGKFHGRKPFNEKTTTIGVVKDSIGEQPLRRRFPKATIKTFSSEDKLITALLKGKLHAIVSSTQKTGYLINQHKDVIFQPDIAPITKHAEGFGIRKGDADILNFLNTWILFNTQNGWLPARHHYWFNTIFWADQL